MADEEKTPEQIQQEMFDQTLAPAPIPDGDNKPPEPEPAPQPEVPAPPPAAAAPPPEPPEAAIPSWRLREEAEARRLAEDRARMLEARLNEVAAHMRQQVEKQPDFFENPDAATQALLTRYLQPIVEEQRRVQMYNSRVIAGIKHGDDKVDEAEQAFLDARSKETLDPVDYERVVQSPNRYDAVVQWHRRQAILSSVGDDPNAWWEKQFDQRMADPKFQAKVLEKVRGSAANRPSETKLPPSLSKATAVASNAGEPIGDLSDKSLFEYAMRPDARRTRQ